MRDRPLRVVSSAFESPEPACRAEALDEYRELAMLAHAWERGSLQTELTEGVPGGVGEPTECASGSR